MISRFFGNGLLGRGRTVSSLTASTGASNGQPPDGHTAATFFSGFLAQVLVALGSGSYQVKVVFGCLVMRARAVPPFPRVPLGRQ